MLLQDFDLCFRGVVVRRRRQIDPQRDIPECIWKEAPVELCMGLEIVGLGGGPEGFAVGGGEGHDGFSGAGAEEVGFFDGVDEGVMEDDWVGFDEVSSWAVWGA